MSETLVYLDDSPAETRGMIYRDGWRRILIDRLGRDRRRRLGARYVGRVDRVDANLKGAFVEQEGYGHDAFLPLKGGQRLDVGQKVEVEVVAEARESKGPTLRLLGPAAGEPRLLAAGPSVEEWLQRFAPGIEPVRGKEAIEAGWRAIEDAERRPFLPAGPEVFVQRTRAMVTVDIDLAPPPGKRLSPADRMDANRRGMAAAARMIQLRRLGGLVAIDLMGVGHDGAAITRAARAAFGDDPDIAYGPVNRFGVLMLSLPWRFTPLSEVLYREEIDRSLWPADAAVEVARRLRHALLSDTAAPRIIARCDPRVAEMATALVAQLGPRAHVTADSGVRPSEIKIEAP